MTATIVTTTTAAATQNKPMDAQGIENGEYVKYENGIKYIYVHNYSLIDNESDQSSKEALYNRAS